MNFFTTVINKQTYKNILYLLLSFPLGIFYFVFLITGISLGIGLSITYIGIPIILGTIYCSFKFMSLEKGLAKLLLNIDIGERQLDSEKSEGIFKRFINQIKNPYTWKSIGYLFIRFPLGIISFCIVITLVAASLGIIAVPLLYYMRDVGITSDRIVLLTFGDGELITSYGRAFITSAIGLLLLLTSLNIINVWAQKPHKFLIKSM